MASVSEPTFCLRHRQTETRIRCSRCGDPICPECMIQLPVGMGCPSCVTFNRNPMVHVQPAYALRAIGAAFALAIVMGIVLSVIIAVLGGIFMVLMWVAAGYVMGQAVCTVANRSHARPLRLVSAAGLFLTWIVVWIAVPVIGEAALLFSVGGLAFSLLGLAIGVYVAMSPFR